MGTKFEYKGTPFPIETIINTPQHERTSTSSKLTCGDICATICASICCLIIFWAITLGPLLGIEFFPRLLWNNNAETSSVNITAHEVYIVAGGGQAYVRGWIYVNFPEDSETKFDMCGSAQDTEKKCRNYLKKYYPIGNSITIYYDPDDLSDVRLHKNSMTASIVFFIIFGIMGICCSSCVGTMICMDPH